MLVATSQGTFLSNDKKKITLINLLRAKLQAAGFTTCQAEEDADQLILTTAIRLATSGTRVVIVGEDTNLLVLLTQLGSGKDNIYFLERGKGKTPDKIYTSKSFVHDELTPLVSFLHAFCGCDTTSCFYGRGKNVIVKLVLNDTALQECAEYFYDTQAKPQELADKGKKIILKL